MVILLNYEIPVLLHLIYYFDFVCIFSLLQKMKIFEVLKPWKLTWNIRDFRNTETIKIVYLELSNNSWKDQAAILVSIMNILKTEWLNSCLLTFKFAFLKFCISKCFYIHTSVLNNTNHSLKTCACLKSVKAKARFHHIIKN